MTEEIKPVRKVYVLKDKDGPEGSFYQKSFIVGEQPEDAHDVLPTEKYVDGRINWETKEYYEGATPEEIEAYNKSKVPSKVSAIQFIAQLELQGITEAAIMQVIDTLPEPNKTIARVSYKRAVYFERNNPFISLVGQSFSLSEDEIDQIFINAENI